MDATNNDLMNQALISAYSDFEQNPAYSSANAEFSSAMNAFPASVTSSLYCSGYSGIDIHSLPAWLTPVPTAIVSIILHEQLVYQSIISSFEENASMTWSASASTPKSTIVSPLSHITTTTASGLSASAFPTNLATPSSLSTAASDVSGSLIYTILAAAGLILAILL